jgi:hypothetical protein
MSDDDEFFDFDDEHEEHFHDAAESACTSMPIADWTCLATTVADDHMPVSIATCFLQVVQTTIPALHMPQAYMQLPNTRLMRMSLLLLTLYSCHRVNSVMQYVHKTALMSCVQSQGCF